MINLKDPYNRKFKTLRVSLTNSCNLGCLYCTIGEKPGEGIANVKSKYNVEDLLSTIGNLHKALGLESIRLTGGEPLLHKSLNAIIKGIKALGIDDIKITTNGLLLKGMSKSLKLAGTKSINVSLDALDEETFFCISKRKNVQRVLDGIEEALASGLEVKMNTVIMKGLNEGQILPLINYAFERGVIIRFLEVMAMGHLHNNAKEHLFLQKEVLETINQKYNFYKLERKSSATANYWKTEEGHVFGIIANESAPFCQDCNRLRLDSQGRIYGCLSSNNPISTESKSEQTNWQEKLQRAMDQKQQVKFTGSALSMLDIGG